MEQAMNLHDVWHYCQQLMTLPMNQIETIPLEKLASLYETANLYVREETYRLANELGILGINDVQLHGIYKNYWGTCSSKGKIVLSLSILFDFDYIGLQCVIIHELCHIKYLNHRKEFWKLYERCIRTVGIIDDEYDGWKKTCVEDSPFMFRSPGKYILRRKYTVIRNKMFSRKIRDYVMYDNYLVQRPISYCNKDLSKPGIYCENRKQEYIYYLNSTKHQES